MLQLLDHILYIVGDTLDWMTSTSGFALSGKRKGLLGSGTDEAGDNGHAASMAEASDPCRGVIRFKARKLAGTD